MVFDVDAAFAALGLLLDGRNRGLFSDIEFFKGVAEIGPLCRIEIKQAATGSAGNLATIYEPSDHLQAFLTAISTRYRDANNPSQLTPHKHLDALQPAELKLSA